ncbi:hypothetical protein [Methylovulum miyakonense]|uniref:hypothetical protein n=1 Tax=Methylovulum miyakonense TaxID=645578 RepID=UPI0003787AB9|nr:hypothetical protein [Methylovulum miyakonense]
MSCQYVDFPERSQKLLAAGRLLLESIRDEEVDRGIAIQNIESATQAVRPSEFILGFKPAIDDESYQPAYDADDVLSGLLFELQSANILMSSGIALNEHGRGSDVALLNQSLLEIAISKGEVTQDLQARAKLAFSPESLAKSPNLDKAKETFRLNADSVLTGIVDDAVPVVNALFEQLKKLDATKVLEAIAELGKSYETIAAAGNLIRKGAEKLKNALEALSKLLGSEVLNRIKDKIQQIWQKFQDGEHTRALLHWAFGVEEAESLIAKVCTTAGVGLGEYDSASHDLSALYSRYGNTIKLLRSLISAVALAGGIMAFLHLSTPAVPLAMAGVYAVLIAATVLVGMDYCDSGRGLGWVDGVGKITDKLLRPEVIQTP